MTHRGKKPSKLLLKSDTSGLSKPSSNSKSDTARTRVRQAIIEQTKPKRDAFILANKQYFVPLLPQTNYLAKLELRNMKQLGETLQVVEYVPVPQPRGVKATMKPYQLEGLSFLAYMYNNGVSAILGDEMGLGKTLQTLALFQHLEECAPAQAATSEVRPHLVVCPLSVLSSWVNEARKWVPDLHVTRFHGPKTGRERMKKELLVSKEPLDVVITTYETFVAEEGWFKRVFAWRYCVLDEGHKIKSASTEIASALQSLQAEHRLLLTGTPLQNNLHEMWSLLHWLYPEVFPIDTADNFKRAFDLSKGQVSTEFMNDARQLLELIMLRRMKSSPGVDLNLPPKEEVLLYVPLTPMQRFWYTRLLTKADNAMLDDLFKDAQVKELEKHDDEEGQLSLLEKAAAAAERTEQIVTGASIGGTADVWAGSREIIEQAVANEADPDVKGGAWKKLMNLVMQLRKVCSHPYLLKAATPEPYLLGQHIKTASGKFIVLEKLIDHLLLQNKKKVIIFSGFTATLNLCEDLLMLKGANAHEAAFRYTRLDGSTPRAKRNLGIRMFNDRESDFKVILISTRAGGLGINLASATNVIFLDEDWNPQITLQAEARAHRIGQTQPVTVYKICTSGTVEEQMSKYHFPSNRVDMLTLGFSGSYPEEALPFS